LCLIHIPLTLTAFHALPDFQLFILVSKQAERMHWRAELAAVEQLLWFARPDSGSWSGPAQRAISARIDELVVELIALRSRL
jgi:hypothetical protein